LATPRLYLTGRVLFEHGERTIADRDLPGRPGRMAFVFLAVNRRRPVSRGDLVEAIWGGDPPGDVDASLNAILSRLRAAMRRIGCAPEGVTIEVQGSLVNLRLRADTWVDVEAAVNALDEAEGLLRVGDDGGAWGCANVAVAIMRRPFLPDLEAPWIESRRAHYRVLLARALQCLAAASETGGQASLAIQYTIEILEVEPFRETAWQQLMRLHAGMGNRAEALQAFARCRELLRDELGASPSPQTEAVFLDILRAGA
jgi:SARP family transcriptional regulator, regulator of embCAB operon